MFYPYSWFFTNIAIYYMYSGGMPLMYLFGIIHFIGAYYCYRFLFIFYHRKSWHFDESIPLYTITLFKYVLFVHLLMIMFMYTNKRLLTPHFYDTEVHYRPKKARVDWFFKRRYDTTAPQAVLMVCLSLLVVFCIWKCCCSIICGWFSTRSEQQKAMNMEDVNHFGKDEEMAMAAADDHSDDIFKEYNMRALRDFYIRSQKEFELFRTMFNAISYDQEKLSDEYAKHFKKKLKFRILNIEDTIDVHLNLIGGLERFMDRSYMYKLAVLDANDEKIPMRDDKSMRMVDLVQSYYIYDSLEFEKPKQMLQSLDR